MRTRSSVAGLVAVALVAVATWATHVAAADDCSAADGPVNCKACREGGDINFVSSIPRYNQNGEKVSSNMGEFDWVVCTGDDCEWWDGNVDNVKASNPASYIEGVASYATLGFVMAPLSFLCMTCCCLWRMCGCCGGWAPQYVLNKKSNKRCFCCRCGYRRNLNPLLDSEDKFTYSTTIKLAARVCMLIFVILTFVFIGIGQQMGNVAMTDAAKRLANAPDSTVTTIRKLITPGHRLVVDIASNTLVPTMEDINATLLDAVNLPLLINATGCVADKAHAPPGLQELMVMVTTILGLKAKVQDADPAVVDTVNVLAGVSSALDVEAPKLQVLLRNLSEARTIITADLSALDFRLAVVEVYVTTLRSQLGPILSDIDVMTNSSKYPTSTQVDDVANGGANTATLQELVNDASTFSDADVTTLTTGLNAVLAKLQQLPDTRVTADNIDAVTATRASVVSSNVINSTIEVLANVTVDMRAVPGSAAATGPVNNMMDAINAVNTTKIVLLVEDLNATVNSIPDPQRFAVLVDDVFAIADIVPCIDSMTPIVESVNATLVSLPDFVNEILNMSNAVKDQVDSARSIANDAQQGLEQVQNHTDSIKFDKLDQLTTSMKNVQTTSDTEFSAVLVHAAGLDKAQNISFTKVESGLNNVYGLVTGSSLDPDASLMSQMRSFGENRSVLVDLLPTVVSSITTWSAKRCTGNAEPCTVDADCSSGTCQARLKQCSVNSTTPGATCTGTSTSECSGGECLFAASTYTALRAALNEYSPQTFAAGSLDSAMADLLSELNGLDLATPRANVTQLRDDLLLVNIESANATLNDALAQGDDLHANVAETNSTWQTVVSSTSSVPDASSVQGQLEMLNSTVAQLDDIGDKTRTFVDLLKAVREFLYDTLPPIFADISAANLNAAFEEHGIVGTYRRVIAAAKNITDFMAAQQSRVNSVGSGGSNLTLREDLDKLDKDVIPRLDVLSQDKYFDNGPYYFIASLMEYDTVQPDDPNAFRVFRGKDGEKYAGDDLCLTTKCINNEVDFVNRQPLSDVLKSFEVDVPGGSSMFLTREQATGIPFIFPGLAALLGLLAAVVCCPKSSRFQRLPTCLMGCCLCFCIPLTFLFSSLPLLLVMVGGDMCRGGANVGYQVVTQPKYAADMCDMFGASVANNNVLACNISIGSGAYTQLELPKLIMELFGTCTSTDAVWNQMLRDVQDNFVDIPVERVNETLDGMSGGTFSPRPRIRKDLVNGARRMGTTGRNFIGNINDVLTCNEVNGDLVAFKEAICCDTMSAFYWSIMAWNVLAWVMLCCGCPACIWGYKRFPARPWGSRYKDLVRVDKRQLQNKAAEEEAMLNPAGGAIQMVDVANVNGLNDSFGPVGDPMMFQQPPGVGPAPVTGNAAFTTPPAWQQQPPQGKTMP